MKTFPPVTAGALLNSPIDAELLLLRLVDVEAVVVNVPISKFPTGGKVLFERELLDDELPSSQVPIFISDIGPPLPPPKVGGEPPLSSLRELEPENILKHKKVNNDKPLLIRVGLGPKSVKLKSYLSQDSSVGSISAWYLGGPGFKSQQEREFFS